MVIHSPKRIKDFFLKIFIKDQSHDLKSFKPKENINSIVAPDYLTINANNALSVNVSTNARISLLRQ